MQSLYNEKLPVHLLTHLITNHLLDINECLKSPCDVNANCNDTIGSYTCSCKSGFNKQGDKCVDVNECLTTPCHSKAACKNTNGSFSCGPCETGYSGNGFNCTGM